MPEVGEQALPPAVARSQHRPRHFGRHETIYIVLGLLPLALAGGLALTRLAAVDGVAVELIGPFAGLFATTLGFAYYALSRNPGVHQLPFIWVFLLLMEFVLSPIHDLLLDIYPLESSIFVAAMRTAIIACALFTLGIWLGLLAANRVSRRRGPYPLHSAVPRYQTGPMAILIVVGFAGAGLATEIYILASSGALAGDLLFARGAGLIGSTALMPLVRLADIATLLASWLSLVAISPIMRRRFFWLALVSLSASLVMPLVLQQRFGLLQSSFYFALPRLASGRWLALRSRRFFFALIPLLLIAAFMGNFATGVARGMNLKSEQVNWREILRSESEDRETNHFRHMWLLADLVERGVDEPNFGGLYEGVPILGDFLIILPRVWFPEKPITSMEVVNGVAMGIYFSALDRGTVSVSTGSLWIQLYLLGGTSGMVFLAFVFSFGSVLLWGFSMRRTDRAVYVIMACVLWVQLGWLAFNVVLTTLEIPGMLLGMLAVRVLSSSQRPSDSEASRA
jgi:hypothetical protein